MKNRILLLFFSLLSCMTIAQEQSFFDENKNAIRVFGGPIFELGLNFNNSVTVGGVGGISFGNYFIGGFGIESYFGEIEIDNSVYQKSYELGGFVIGYVLPSDEPAHFFSSLKLGWGTAILASKSPKVISVTDEIFAFNPELGMEISVTSSFRLSITASYRLIGGVEKISNLNNYDFENYSVGIGFRFGSFGCN